MSIGKHIQQLRSKTIQDIQRLRDELNEKESLLNAYDIILQQHADELFSAGSFVSIGSGMNDLKNESVVSESDVLKVLISVRSYIRTKDIARMLFPDLEDSEVEFNRVKLEVSAALTRLKQKDKVKRKGPASASYWAIKETEGEGNFISAFSDLTELNKAMQEVKRQEDLAKKLL